MLHSYITRHHTEETHQYEIHCVEDSTLADSKRNLFNRAREELRKVLKQHPDSKSDKIIHKQYFDSLVNAFKTYNIEAKKADLYHLVLDEDHAQHDYLNSYFKEYCYEKSNALLRLITFPALFIFRALKRALTKTDYSYLPSDEYQIQMDYSTVKAFVIQTKNNSNIDVQTKRNQLIKKIDDDISADEQLKENGNHDIGPSTTYRDIITSLKEYREKNPQAFFITRRADSDMKKSTDLLKIASNPHWSEKAKIKKTRKIVDPLDENNPLRQAVYTAQISKYGLSSRRK